MIRRNTPASPSVLVDTNVHLRLLRLNDPLYGAALASTLALRAAGNELCVVPQVIYEFWAVATRPHDDRGFGFSRTRVAQEIEAILANYRFADDEPKVFAGWFRLVVSHDVQGKPAHDTRLVAAMNVHGIGKVLTFNLTDFRRYRDIELLDAKVVGGAGA